MDLLEQNPEYLELLGRAGDAPCTCKEETQNLLQAAENGCLRCCAKLIDQAGQLVNDWTALMKATRQGHLEIVQLLIPHEAKMHEAYGETALMISAYNGHVEVLKLLVPHEAGMKDCDGKTAMALAAEFYQLKCLGVLLESEAEREASQPLEVISAAYTGDVRELHARRNEWQTKYLSLTVLDFALLGRRRRVIRVLTHHRASREFFGRETISKAAEAGFTGTRFLSCHRSLVSDLLPVICLAEDGCSQKLLLSSLGEETNTARYLRSVCTPSADHILPRLVWLDKEAEIIGALKNLKNVGLSSNGITALHYAKEGGRCIQEYAETNPLRQTQIKIAVKEAKKRVREARQAAWRQVEAESAFNRRLLVEARGVVWGSTPVQKLVHDRNSNWIREKRQLCEALLMGSMRIMWDAVQEMLAE